MTTATKGLMPIAESSSEALFQRFLESLGINTRTLSMQDTPARVVRMYKELLTPIPFTPTVFESDGYDSLVVQTGIHFYSLCEHHLLPFEGVAHVGYLPAGRVIGLSKLARFVESRARALQLQERMTEQIADDLSKAVGTDTVGVILAAKHFCMGMRGVKVESATHTNTMRGQLRENASLKQEFMDAVRNSS